jgi:hypothetical protein
MRSPFLFALESSCMTNSEQRPRRKGTHRFTRLNRLSIRPERLIADPPVILGIDPAVARRMVALGFYRVMDDIPLSH